MTTFTRFSAQIGDALGVSRQEVNYVARRQSEAGLGARRPKGRKPAEIGGIDGARLLVAVMVTCIERPVARASSLVRDIVRLGRLHHGALLYFDPDFLLPDGFVEAVGEILIGLGDPARRDRVQNWIGGIGIALGSGKMAAWIEVHSPLGDEDFDYAASPDDLVFLTDKAPMVRRVEVTMPALSRIALLLTPSQAAPRRRKKAAA